MSSNTHQPDHPSASIGTLFKRGLFLRCPVCGKGKLFRKWFSMYTHCSNCRLKYERDPGYFLGSTYINYAVTAVSVTVFYFVFHFGLEVSNKQLSWWLGGYCVLFPLLFFRLARSLWLAMDSFFDATDLCFEPETEEPKS
ncbi:hypothetical protein MNBD_PLANCTO02-1693 [hydrothermal vent metagenome]|uniref:DUF983 domain-containing protein n=1 Tax=hydrothermal vent metagenome TaxID=652676 RepID=A0A3B1DTB6_9ZZZZ